MSKVPQAHSQGAPALAQPRVVGRDLLDQPIITLLKQHAVAQIVQQQVGREEAAHDLLQLELQKRAVILVANRAPWQESLTIRREGTNAGAQAAGIRRGSGTYVMPPTPPPDIDLETWRASLDLLQAWDAETLFVYALRPLAGRARTPRGDAPSGWPTGAAGRRRSSRAATWTRMRGRRRSSRGSSRTWRAACRPTRWSPTSAPAASTTRGRGWRGAGERR